MKIVLFGEDIFTAAVLETLLHNGHEIPSVICPVYNNSLEYRTIEKAAVKRNIPFLHERNVNADTIKEHLLNVNPDLIISVHLRKILLKEIFSIPSKGTLNIHPSLLPKYRGLSPQHQALLHGDKETGVTIHYIDEGVDTGDIIIQDKILLSGTTYIYDLQVEMIALYKRLIIDALGLIDSKDFKPAKQDNSVLSYYGPLKDSDRKIDLKKTTFEIYNLIRAVSKPYKGAYYENFIIWTSFVVSDETEKGLTKKNAAPGIYEDQNGLIIKLCDGLLVSDDFEIVIG